MTYFDWRRVIKNLALDVEYCASSAIRARKEGDPDELERLACYDAEATTKAAYAAALARAHCRPRRKVRRAKRMTSRLNRNPA
jgi:hypothetical protein